MSKRKLDFNFIFLIDTQKSQIIEWYLNVGMMRKNDLQFDVGWNWFKLIFEYWKSVNWWVPEVEFDYSRVWFGVFEDGFDSVEKYERAFAYGRLDWGIASKPRLQITCRTATVPCSLITIITLGLQDYSISTVILASLVGIHDIILVAFTWIDTRI